MSSNNYYQLYLNATMRLAGSLNILSTLEAQLVNQWVELQLTSNGLLPGNYFNTQDPTTWKYYKNLAGEYFEPLDKPIYVTSLDNNGQIRFDAPTLANHPTTRQAYKIGSVYYQKLTTQYPAMVWLINCILYPADINAAVNGDDGLILNYETDLVESNEVTLIQELQDWIYRFKSRWYNAGYYLSDSLYPATFAAIMYLNVVPKIVNLRLKRAKTPEANSFHVDQYLASHNGLLQYASDLSLAQRLFLYRNINYLQRHAGEQANFEWLVEKLLTASNVALCTYDIAADGFDSATNERTLVLQRRFLNNVVVGAKEDTFTIDAILSKEETLYNNSQYISDFSTDISDKIARMKGSRLTTKLLETPQTEVPALTEHTLNDVYLNYWPWLAVNGYYTNKVTFTDPRSGIIYSATAMDAYIYMLYVQAWSMGISLETVPEFWVQRVPVLNKVLAVSDLETVLDKNYIPPLAYLNYLIDNQVPPTRLTNVSEFNTFCNQAWNYIQLQDNFISSLSNIDQKAQYRNMINQFYIDSRLNFIDTGSDINAWLSARNLPSYKYSTIQAQSIIQELILQATGVQIVSSESYSLLQNSLVSIFKSLSSYDIQFLPNNQNVMVYIIELLVGIGEGSSQASYTTGATIDTVEDPAEYLQNQFIGYATYTALNPLQQQALTDIYG